MTGTAAIIGGGVIGGGWAARFLLNGWDVALCDPDPEAERKMAEMMANARHALPMLYDVAMPDEGRLRHARTIADAVGTADFIQESVPERLDLKHRVLAEIEAAARTDVVIGSSTSGFKPSELQQGARRPERVLVTHPFNPVYLLPVVELVPSPANSEAAVAAAGAVLRSIGMHPLQVRKEIDAHIADRLLEAVWREALWLIKDGVATTREIDDVIRYGFGLRWAQMGLFETYRIAGGEAGMRHFIEQFGPCLSWPWTKLTDVPDLTDDLINMIADQSDAQSGALSIRALERLRDDNLVGILRSLKARDAAAGALLNAHQATMARPVQSTDGPITTLRRVVPVDWADYNGHMNESRYGQVYSDAADEVMRRVGADAGYVAGGMSYFTVDCRIRFLAETLSGETIFVHSRVLEGKGKKLRLFSEMFRDDGTLLSTGEQVLIHVDLATRRACEPAEGVRRNVEALAAAHAGLARPRSVM